MKKMLVSLIVALILIPTTTITLAYANHFNGGYRNISNIGASAEIEVQHPYATARGQSSAWVMTCPLAGSNYAQVGWCVAPLWSVNNPKHFYAWCSDSAVSIGFGPYVSAGTFHTFKVGRDSSRMYFVYDDITLNSVNLSKLGWSAGRIEISAETMVYDDRCAGTALNPVSFSYCKYKDTNYIWRSTVVYPFPVKPSWFSNNLGSNGSSHFEVWDNR